MCESSQGHLFFDYLLVMIMTKFCIQFARWVNLCSQICSLETIHSFVFVEHSRCLSIIIDTTTQGVASGKHGSRRRVQSFTLSRLKRLVGSPGLDESCIFCVE